MGDVVVGTCEAGEVEEVARHPAPGEAAGFGERNDLAQHLLHVQRGPDVDAHPHRIATGIGEPVHDSGLDLEDLACRDESRPAADAEAGAALEDFEPFGLDRVHVGHRYASTRAEVELEGEELPVRGTRGLDEGEPFAGDRVGERVAWLDVGSGCHAPSQAAARRDAQWLRVAIGYASV